ncbi:methionine ABC transporter permease [Turicibacter sp. TJ11]|uniref:methionine ABC transporter permease n=1 Tax=Turicibacter sp. TJ11 TaxID=2806443 RepID=UPI001F39A3EF|nr:methionine ABC transporter permease [Turicibacter sp. TJ11]
MFVSLIPNVRWDKMLEATTETLYMTAISSFFVFILGLILGLILFLTSKNQLLENRWINSFLSAIVNIFRSIPFVILIILLLNVTKFLVGTILGPNAALPALIISAAPFYGRLVEIALREIDKGVIEASVAMGASLWTIILKVLIPESLPALVSGITVTTISLVSYTTMAGVIGAGGLGNLAYLDGFQRQRFDVVFVATVIILILVFILQFIGDTLTKKIDRR